MYKRICFLMISFVIFLLLPLLFIRCNKNDTNYKEIITIGVISPFSGEGARYGQLARMGVDLAVDEINNSGGINGNSLRIQYEDDKGNPRDAVSAFNKLININKVQIILGPFYSTNVLACAPIAENNKIVLLTPTATADSITNAGDYIFRICPKNLEQAKTIAEYAFKKKHLSKAFILYRNVDYGVTLKDGFINIFKELGGYVLGSEPIIPDTFDVRSQIIKANTLKPDFIFAAVHYPEGSAILKQLKELNIKTVVFGTDGGFDPKLIEIAKDSAENSYWTTIGWGSGKYSSQVNQFKNRFIKKYKAEPGVYSGLFYDAMYVVYEAMRLLKTYEGQEIQKQLYKTQFIGSTGLTKFDKYGDVLKPFSIYRINKSKFIQVE